MKLCGELFGAVHRQTEKKMDKFITVSHRSCHACLKHNEMTVLKYQLICVMSNKQFNMVVIK